MKTDRFWRRVLVQGPDECWPWRFGVDRDGYGRCRSVAGEARAHRVAWEHHHGKAIPDGALVIHSCDNPRCCNPAHLSLGTVQDNVADRVRKGRSAKGRRPNPLVGEISRTRIDPPAPVVDQTAAFLKMLTNKKRLRKQWLKEVSGGGEGGI